MKKLTFYTLYVFLALFSSALLADGFPLRGFQLTELGDHRRMETSITISDNGRVDGVTHIWTAKHWLGFTGNVVVFVTDSPGNILYSTQPHSYGVDGLYTPGVSDRTQQWSDQIPVDILSKVKGYVIYHGTDPHPRLEEFLTKLHKWF